MEGRLAEISLEVNVITLLTLLSLLWSLVSQFRANLDYDKMSDIVLR